VDLIIVGRTPGMGKPRSCNIAKNVAQLHQLPVCVFSLEIAKAQLPTPCFRWRRGHRERAAAHRPAAAGGMAPARQSINTLGQLPLSSTDKANAGVLEIALPSGGG